MPFTLIKGFFAPDLGRPDGDSMRFVADDPAPFFRLRRRGRPPRINADNGSIQLRYEAIDTMESRALEAFSAAATAANLDFADATAGRSRGYVCSTQLGPHGRPIVFAFAGETTHTGNHPAKTAVGGVDEATAIRRRWSWGALPAASSRAGVRRGG